MGAAITLSGGGRCLPACVSGAALKGIGHVMAQPCAQGKAALLLAGTMALGETSVTERFACDARLESLLSRFGAGVRREGLTTTVRGGMNLAGQRLAVPPDLSWAASQADGTSRLRGALADGAGRVAGFLGLLKDLARCAEGGRWVAPEWIFFKRRQHAYRHAASCCIITGPFFPS